MNKMVFDLKKQVMFVYLRHEGRCAACGGEVNPREVAMDMDMPSPLQIDDLLRVRLMHPFCKVREAREAARTAAKAA